MLRFAVRAEVPRMRVEEMLQDERGGIDELLMKGLFVVAVLGIAAAVIGYFSGLNNWIGNKLTTFMNTH